MPLTSRRLPAALALAVLLSLALFALLTALGGDEAPAAAASTATITNPYFPLATVRRNVLAGHERNDEGRQVRTRSVAVVQTRTVTISGLESVAVDVRDYENGKLIEHTTDYYAQRANGDVLYMGEDVDDIENGKVVSHGGQWRAGRRGAKPGLFMPAHPRRGRTFRQERAPGVAEDESTIVGTGRRVTTPAGRFRNCVKTRDFSPLDKGSEHKYYCRGVGLVREDVEGGNGLLTSYDEG